MESLKMKIRHIARRLAEEELMKKHHKGGIVAFGEGEGEAMHHKRHMTRAHKPRGRALIDTYGLSVEGGKRRVGRPRKARAGIIAYGMDEMDDMGCGERMHKHKKHMSRGRALDDNYGLQVVSGGRRTYYKEHGEYVKRTRKPSAYNMFVKEYILKNRGSNISDAAAEWRNRK